MNRTYWAVPVLKCSYELVEQYWQDIIKANLLKDRLCDILNPDIDDIFGYIKTHGPNMYNVYEDRTKMLVADFALTGFTGKSAQVHFSMHPDNTPQYSMMLARTVTDDILNVWGEENDLSTPYLYSLYGLTPVVNRAACAFVQRVGFKKVATLPGGQLYAGEPVDAIVTIKGASNGRQRRVK